MSDACHDAFINYDRCSDNQIMCKCIYDFMYENRNKEKTLKDFIDILLSKNINFCDRELKNYLSYLCELGFLSLRLNGYKINDRWK